MAHVALHAADCLQAFTGADIIVHEIGNNVSVADLQHKPATVRDDRVVSAYSS